MREVIAGMERHTRVFASDEPDGSGGNHEYVVLCRESKDSLEAVRFQKGPLLEAGINGSFDEDMLLMLIDRLRGFQSGPYSCRENALALTKLEEALHWLDSRRMDRQRRGVEGKNEK